VERLALIGVSHRRGGASALEHWQKHFDTAALSALGFSETVPIVTCNRWDLVVSLSDGLSLAEARQRLTPAGIQLRPYAYEGDGALEQLTRIAASLDSLNPGEDQIMAQVREAFAAAQGAGTTGPLTSFAFNTALRIAKRVRRELDLAPLHTSLFSLARPELETALPTGGWVAIVGAGEMGSLAAQTLADLPGFKLLIVNRTLERAQNLAAELKAEAMSLTEFLRQPPQLDALVCATPVPHWLTQALAERLPQLKLIIDLGIPRNVAPEVQASLRVLDVDTLQQLGQERRQDLREKLSAAERLIQVELELALAEWTEKQLGPSIKKLRDWYLETIGDTLNHEDAVRLAHKFAHVPIKGLRAVAREYGLEAARLFLAEAGLDE
jgi:glutamyl-tRNA reductase